MMREVSIVIPVKGGANAKSRLSAVLTQAERLALARSMAAHVIKTARASQAGGCVTVITGCNEMAGLARELGAQVLNDPYNEGTAAACLLAVPALDGRGSILFLSADLPLIEVQSLDAMIAIDAPVMIVPDRHRTGTNALLIRPETGVRPCFGAGSFARHCAAASAAGVAAVIFDDVGLAHDIDVAEDLADQRAAALLQRRAA
jgi:2-phospho-L-lactate/phosphoenolpyruvate guanylyltransferase